MIFLFWSLVALFGVLPGFLGMYLVLSPIDHLTVRYQNLRLSMSQMPLKDEDFPHMGRIVFLIKLIGFLMIAAGIGVISIALEIK
ncbi:hypothetical protein [Rubellicoccus peritrichatus]|uniref:Uncharacterized protein n=1 Tax=Rubellicoccus peritrichatus TaxID=3080537 RepID=A0AAQ3LBN6_9BACT|nr:hypothetical protein [Puniceicoccus sp. CR14]WOO41574.1 hypothetical protein RZN69_00635 [Puniceicoccus sp. CR14]